MVSRPLQYLLKLLAFQNEWKKFKKSTRITNRKNFDRLSDKNYYPFRRRFLDLNRRILCTLFFMSGPLLFFFPSMPFLTSLSIGLFPHFTSFQNEENRILPLLILYQRRFVTTLCWHAHNLRYNRVVAVSYRAFVETISSPQINSPFFTSVLSGRSDIYHT